jgi:hypothetical protein
MKANISTLFLLVIPARRFTTAKLVKLGSSAFDARKTLDDSLRPPQGAVLRTFSALRAASSLTSFAVVKRLAGMTVRGGKHLR